MCDSFEGGTEWGKEKKKLRNKHMLRKHETLGIRNRMICEENMDKQSSRF